MIIPLHVIPPNTSNSRKLLARRPTTATATIAMWQAMRMPIHPHCWLKQQPITANNSSSHNGAMVGNVSSSRLSWAQGNRGQCDQRQQRHTMTQSQTMTIAKYAHLQRSRQTLELSPTVATARARQFKTDEDKACPSCLFLSALSQIQRHCRSSNGNRHAPI